MKPNDENSSSVCSTSPWTRGSEANDSIYGNVDCSHCITFKNNNFLIFQLNLNKPCPFWSDQEQCAVKNCKVDFCSEVFFVYSKFYGYSKKPVYARWISFYITMSNSITHYYCIIRFYPRSFSLTFKHFVVA